MPKLYHSSKGFQNSAYYSTENWEKYFLLRFSPCIVLQSLLTLDDQMFQMTFKIYCKISFTFHKFSVIYKNSFFTDMPVLKTPEDI